MRRISRRRRRTPRWAFWTLVLGSALLVVGGGGAVGVRFAVAAATAEVGQDELLGGAKPIEEKKNANVDGAKNVLLVGIDQRPDQINGEPLRSDSIILLHINKDHSSGYLISLPRDTYVDIPAYDNGAQSFAGGKLKINAAFAFGTRGLKGKEALKHGFELLTMTVKELTGITPDAGAIIDFQGFRDVVKVLGRVCMYVDTTTTSIHRGTDANGKPAAPFVINKDGTLRSSISGVKPKVYTKGDHCFSPADALDFVRQRDLLGDKSLDYGRQRHQQQFFKAIINQAVSDGLDSPTKLPALLSAFGKSMTVDKGGIDLADWALGMRGLKPDRLVTIKTNAGKLNSKTVPGVGSVELLTSDSLQLLQAIKKDSIDSFLLGHPEFIAAN
ncbi:LCP family protein [Actinoplanes oblitus]|uniref:LCP family protein n=1 Tax=Actinoplanes oblitus TaxID=3040509 RepID=A0ABY8WMW6_9ACTN|nr:LCP family protein [Actinoplanes oblitus]WIM98448.1 LCP family protein [Actinoplanes oblitus]